MEGATTFPGSLHFTFDPYLIILRVKRGGIKYHFLSLWYNSTWYWTPVSQTIGEHSTHMAKSHTSKTSTVWLLIFHLTNHSSETIAQSAGAVQYTNKCPGYRIKQSDVEIPAMMALWGMRSTPLLPLLPGPLWPGVVAPDRVLSIGQT